MKYHSFLIAFVLFILPLIYIPFIPLGFETPKVIIFETLVELICITMIMQNKLSRPTSRFFVVCFAGVILLSFYSLLFHFSSTSLFQNPIRMQGIFLLWHFVFWAYFSAYIVPPVSFSFLPLISLGVLFLSALFLHEPVSYRSVGLLGEPNALASVAVFLFPWILFSKSVFTKKKNILFLGFAIISTLGIVFLSGSRSGLVAIGIEMIVWILTKNKLFTPKIILMIGVSIIVLSLLLPFNKQQSSWEDRGTIWKIAIQAGALHPFLGWGFGNITQALHQTASNVQSPLTYVYVDSSHNIFLDWWIQGGIVGFGILVSFIIYAFKSFLQKNDGFGITLLLGLITVVSFNPASIATLVAFWWLIGRSFKEIAG